jgi:hypothetical protein
VCGVVVSPILELLCFTFCSFSDSSFGMNVFSKCPAKVFAFSLSFRAQAWSALLIGGMRCVGCCNRLVAFQSVSCHCKVLMVCVKYFFFDPFYFVI